MAGIGCDGIMRHAGSREARRHERGHGEPVGRFMKVIGRVVAMDMARQLFGRLALVMRVPVLGDRRGEFGMAEGFGLGGRIGLCPAAM